MLAVESARPGWPPPHKVVSGPTHEIGRKQEAQVLTTLKAFRIASPLRHFASMARRPRAFSPLEKYPLISII